MKRFLVSFNIILVALLFVTACGPIPTLPPLPTTVVPPTTQVSPTTPPPTTVVPPTTQAPPTTPPPTTVVPPTTPPPTTCSTGSIEFTSVPPKGSFDDLQGRVNCVDATQYKIAVYIQVGGWWTKPYWSQPTTSINADGSWTTDITTGGIDETATKIVAYLIPNGINPPLRYGESDLPLELADYPQIMAERQ